MKKGTILLFSVLFTLLFSTYFYTQVIYSEDFESGTANAGWYSYDAGEDITVAKPMTDAPQALHLEGIRLAGCKI